MLVLVLFGIPFLPAVGLTLLLRATTRHGALWAALAGVGIAVGFIVAFAATGRFGTGPSACGSDGCWIDNQRSFVEALVGVSTAFWMLGVGVVVLAAVVRSWWHRTDPVSGREGGQCA